MALWLRLPVSLSSPLHRERLHQPRQRHPLQLPPVQYALDDVRRQQRQTLHARDVGAAC